jgi:DNA-binding LytR/AlgR family response regulator
MEFIFVKDKSVFTKLFLKDILFIEAMKDYVAIHTVDKRHIHHCTLSDVEIKMPSEKFVRINRSFMVQMGFIERIEDGTIYMNGKTFSIGDTYKDNLKSKMNLL